MIESEQMRPESVVPEFGWESSALRGIAIKLAPRVLTLLRRYGLTPGARILDVGCGNGYLGGALLREGFDVTGIDVSINGIRIARDAHPTGRWECLEIGDDLLARLDAEPFDAVISTEVVEHLYAPRAWAHACLRALRPGRPLLCSTPYHGYLKNLVISLRGDWDRHASPMWDGGHIKLWSVHTLRRLLTTAGFEGIEWEGVGRVPYLWRSMLMHAHRPSDERG